MRLDSEGIKLTLVVFKYFVFIRLFQGETRKGMVVPLKLILHCCVIFCLDKACAPGKD